MRTWHDHRRRCAGGRREAAAAVMASPPNSGAPFAIRQAQRRPMPQCAKRDAASGGHLAGRPNPARQRHAMALRERRRAGNAR
ncbi:hypothetical protein, partial [Pseudomonas sp. 71_D]|uniref:hypothetical protein n=1 Tax=Pseudomonas sp. 71_D TaxID=2813564 RepID=UPI001A9F1689